MSTIIHPNRIHEAAVNTAEMNRQQGVSAAIVAGGGSATVAAAVKTAEVTYYRAVIASCAAQGIEAGGFRQGLHDLTGLYV